MFIKDWKREIITIPNMLSLLRLMLIPVYSMIYLNAREFHDHLLAAIILALSCLTDMADGQIARHFHMCTNLGRLLDPLADKLTQLALTVCLSVKYPIMRGVLILFLMKEIFQATVTYLTYRKGKVLPGALIAGKICTAVLFLSFILLVLIPALPSTTVLWLSITDSIVLTYAFTAYYLAYFGKYNKLQDLEN